MKLKLGDKIRVHGWVMLKGLEVGDYIVAKIAKLGGIDYYSFTRRMGPKSYKHISFWTYQIDPWIRPANDDDLNRIEIL